MKKNKFKFNIGITTILVLMSLLLISNTCSATVSVSQVITDKVNYSVGEVVQFKFNVSVTNEEGCCVLGNLNFTITDGNILKCNLPVEQGNYPNYNCSGTGINITVTEANYTQCRQYGGNNAYYYTINWKIPSNWGIGAYLKAYRAIASVYACGKTSANEKTFNILNCDQDSDGYNATVTICGGNDCNDNNASIHPGAIDIPNNGIDENCVGGDNKTYYRDKDNDTYGNATNTTIVDGGAPPAGYASRNADCNDNNPAIHPGATDICEDNIDEDCSGSDAVCSRTYYKSPDVVPKNETVCGDGKCEVLETYETCPKDCPKPIVCGDGVCEGSETYGTCPKDCPKPTACGDGVCEGDETCKTCEKDCGACQIVCGDGVCEGDETCKTCEKDCGACQIVCGDGVCEGDEACKTCEKDCGACPMPKLTIDCPENAVTGEEVTCKVKDDAGNIVAGATVTLSDGRTSTTDEEGNAKFLAVQSGEIDANAVKELYNKSEEASIYVAKGCWLFDIKFIVCWYWWVLLLIIILVYYILTKRKEEEEEEK